MSWSVTEGLTFSTFATASDFRTLCFARLADGNARIDGREYTLETRLLFGSGDDMVSGSIAAYAFRARKNGEIEPFGNGLRSEDHTAALQHTMRIPSGATCVKKNT